MLNWAIILIVVPFVLGWVGNVLKGTVLGPKPWDEEKFSWPQRAYFSTMAWHPVFLAVPLGAAFDAFSWPPVFGDNTLAHYLAAFFASGVAIIGYHLIVKTLRRMIAAAAGAVGARPDSKPPETGGTEDRP